MGHAAKINARTHDHAAAREALACVVVGIANQIQGDALGEKCAKRLAARAFELNTNRVIGKSVGMLARQRTR